MTSVHSQPLHTISYIHNQPQEHFLQPKFHPNHIHFHLNDQSTTNQTLPKKLPFNLFLSPTQYHKMLITNGKNRKNYTPQTIDGLITTLEYMNDPIFQKQLSKRSKYKQILKSTQKTSQKHSHQHKLSINDCPIPKHSFSQDSSQSNQIPQLPQSDKKNQTIDYDTLPHKTKKYSIGHKPNHKKTKPFQEQKKFRSSFEKTKKLNKTSTNDQSLLNKSQTKKNPDISHLLIKSLIQFSEQKKAQNFNRLSMERAKSAKDEYLRLLNHKIRSYNMEHSRRSGGSLSKSKSKSMTKHQLSLQYWDHIKSDVLNSLKNDNYSHLLKDQLKDYSFNVYDRKEIPSRKSTKPHRSEQKMDKIRIVRGMQAQKLMEQKSQQKKITQKRRKQNLRSLEKERLRRIAKNPKKPFRPTAALIHTAFKNIVDNSVYEKGQKSRQVKKANQIFKNEGIRAVKGNKKQNERK